MLCNQCDIYAVTGSQLWAMQSFTDTYKEGDWCVDKDISLGGNMRRGMSLL